MNGPNNCCNCGSDNWSLYETGSSYTVGYYYRCETCHRYTDVYPTTQKATKAWNKGKFVNKMKGKLK